MQLQGEVLVEEEGINGDTPDPFDEPDAKLAALIDLPEPARVLLIGAGTHTGLRGLARSFPGSTEYDDATTAVARLAAGADRFDLIVWGPHRVTGESADLGRLLGRMKGMLAPDGSILLLVRNRFALRGVRRQPARMWDGSGLGRGQYRALVRGAEFSSIEEFLPFPDADALEEMVAAGSELALPGYASLVEHGLNALGLLPRFHEGFAYLLSNGSSGIDRMLERLRAGMIGKATVRKPLRLERFAIRPRGALVLFLAETASNRRLLCRVTTSTAVDVVVRKNARWTQVLRSSATLSPAMKALVPAPLGEVALGPHRAYVEELLPGVVSWKLAVDRRLEPALFAQACAFLREVSTATRESRLLTEPELNAVLPLPRHEWFDPEFSSLLSDLRAHLVRRMEGSVRAFVLSHGDFGYGNLLATRRGKRMTGVFDWDQARIDLEGVDLVNFLIQRHRMKAQVSLAEAVRSVGAMMVENDFRGIDPDSGEEWGHAQNRAARTELFAWAIWRYVERDTRYRREYDRGRDQLANSLRWAIHSMAQ